MKLQVPPQITIHATHRQPAPYETLGLKFQRMPVVRYHLREWNTPIGMRLFYECDECRSGCGCPSFPPSLQSVPVDVMQHLQTHTALSH